jgi:hypothetical protein
MQILHAHYKSPVDTHSIPQLIPCQIAYNYHDMMELITIALDIYLIISVRVREEA